MSAPPTAAIHAPSPSALPSGSLSPLRWPLVPLLILIAASGYGLAFATHAGAAAILVAMPCIFLLSRLKRAISAFCAAALCGLGVYVPHLYFFTAVFPYRASILLWCIPAIPIGLFALLVHQSRKRFGPVAATWITPVLWMGVEFFRSELYYLRFAWVLPGQVVAFLPGLRLLWLGVYGLGFVMALAAALLLGPKPIYRMTGAAITVIVAVLMYWPALPAAPAAAAPLHVAGVQLEDADQWTVADALDRLADAHPEAQILVLNEYSFGGPVPNSVRGVIAAHGRYLVAGGIADTTNGQFRDMAYVIGPDGRDVFQQGKSVPVQFMPDGLPAENRQVWNSPWGKIGIAICYDVSFARVMDDFVRAGAQGLIIPTMDMQNWGRYEREMLHGRLAPIRAAEYGIPVFGVWSSGESQLTNRRGRLIATAPYPGQGDTIAGPFDIRAAGHVPPDRYPALAASLFAGGLLVYFIAATIAGWLEHVVNFTSHPSS